MKFDDHQPARKWFVIGMVALFTLNVDRLATAATGLTLSAVLIPSLMVQNALGGMEGTVAAIVVMSVGLYLLSRSVGLWIVNPLCGLVVLRIIHRDYGPKTKRAVLDWVASDGAFMEMLDVDQLARSHGEAKRKT